MAVEYDARVLIREADDDDVFVAAYKLNNGEDLEAFVQAFVAVDPETKLNIELATAPKQDILADRLGATDSNPADNPTDPANLNELVRLTAVTLANVLDKSTQSLAKLTALELASGSTVPISTRSAPYLKAVTFSVDTSALAAGDVAADTQLITDCTPANDQAVTLLSFSISDESDQASVDMRVVFFNADVALGTENSAPSITDTNSRNIIGFIDIAAADFVDFGGVRVATLTGKIMGLVPVAGSRSVAIGLQIKGGTPTFTSDAVRMNLLLVP